MFVYVANQPNEICSHLREKASKGSICSKITLTKKSEEEKERAWRQKEGEEKKPMVAFIVFIMATLEVVFGRKKTVGRVRSIWRQRFQKSG